MRRALMASCIVLAGCGTSKGLDSSPNVYSDDAGNVIAEVRGKTYTAVCGDTLTISEGGRSISIFPGQDLGNGAISEELSYDGDYDILGELGATTQAMIDKLCSYDGTDAGFDLESDEDSMPTS